MWVKVADEPIPTYGMNGKSFMLNLYYKDYFGHTLERSSDLVIAIWDSICECFREVGTKKEINDDDISEWWEDI